MRRFPWPELLFLLLFGIALLPQLLADPIPATGLTVGNSSRRNLSTGNVSSVVAYAGNVTQIDINAISITQSWQGYFGNISGNIILADADNNSIYEWGNSTATSGEVFASRNESVDWATINCSNSTQIALEHAALGQTASDTDSVNNTFNETDHPDFLVGLRNMTGCPSTNTFVSNAAQNTDFELVLLADANNHTVYTTIIEPIGTTGYNSENWQFQLMVGEDGHGGDVTTTTYYFYTELG